MEKMPWNSDQSGGKVLSLPTLGTAICLFTLGLEYVLEVMLLLLILV